MFKKLKSMIDDKYKVEFILVIFTFILNIPPLLLVIMEYFKPCSVLILALIYAVFPPYFLGNVLNGLLSLRFLEMPIFLFCSFQLILNTVALIKLLVSKGQHNNNFWFCLLFIIINYVIMFIFNVLYLNMPIWCIL